jgi:hypothetical protein
MDTIAERTLICLKSSGERLSITIRIGKPYQDSDVSWACPVEAAGLYQRLADVHGIDSFQALMLAVGLLRRLMHHVIEDGGQFLEPECSSPIDLEQLFAS